jgi:broad specificity phosphatase PhoE
VTRRARVLLIRHGLSAHVHPGGLIDAIGMQRWRDATDAAGIAAHSHPPAELVARVADTNFLMASDLPRAIESARRLAPGRPIETSPLFRESMTEIPKWLPLRWPLRIWRIANGTQWVYRILKGTDAPPKELERIAAAARLLTERVQSHESLTVVCHGVFRRLLGRRLVHEGWTAEPGRHSYANWSMWEYTRFNP